MAISEQQRHNLHDALRDTLGSEHAGVLMEMFPAHDRNELAAKADLHVLGSELRGEMAELRGDMDRRFGEVDRRFSEVIAEIAHLRGDMTLMMATQTRQLTMGLIGFSVATWGALLGGAVLG